MILLIKFLLSFLLIPIFSLHLYWFLGGEFFLNEALPYDLDKIKSRFTNFQIKLFTVLSLTPVLVILGVMFLSLFPLVNIIYQYHSIIYLNIGSLCIIRALIGWLFTEKFTDKELFIRYNTFFYSPIFLILGILYLLLYFS